MVAVRAIDAGGTRSRLVIEVAGKTDYAIGELPHELLIARGAGGPGSEPGRAGAGARWSVGERAARQPRARPGTQLSRGRAAAAGGGATAARLARIAARPARRDCGGPRRRRRPDGSAASAGPVESGGCGVGASARGRHRSWPWRLRLRHRAAGAPLLEKDIALQIALRLQGELEHAESMRDSLERATTSSRWPTARVGQPGGRRPFRFDSSQFESRRGDHGNRDLLSEQHHRSRDDSVGRDGERVAGRL